MDKESKCIIMVMYTKENLWTVCQKATGSINGLMDPFIREISSKVTEMDMACGSLATKNKSTKDSTC